MEGGGCDKYVLELTLVVLGGRTGQGQGGVRVRSRQEHSSKATLVKEDSGGSSSGSRIKCDLEGIVMQRTNNCRVEPRYREPVVIG